MIKDPMPTDQYLSENFIPKDQGVQCGPIYEMNKLFEDRAHALCVAMEGEHGCLDKTKQ